MLGFFKVCPALEVLEKKMALAKYTISRKSDTHRTLRLGEHVEKLVRLAPRAVLDGEQLANLIPAVLGMQTDRIRTDNSKIVFISVIIFRI
jgi:hypothetical protein